MSKLTALLGFLFLAVSSAWAQTRTCHLPASPPAGDARRRRRSCGLLVAHYARHHRRRSHLVLLPQSRPQPQSAVGSRSSSAAVPERLHGRQR